MGYGQALMFLGISFYCVRAIKEEKEWRAESRRMTAGLWNSSVQEITLKRLFTDRRCAIFVCKSEKDARCKLVCATTMMNSNKRDYRRSFGQIN